MKPFDYTVYGIDGYRNNGPQSLHIARQGMKAVIKQVALMKVNGYHDIFVTISTDVPIDKNKLEKEVNRLKKLKKIPMI